MNILLVDDDEVACRTVARFLTGRGHLVRTASEGGEALALVDEAVPDLVISDIQMPGMDGVELLRALRERFPQMPVVLVTAYQTVDTAVAALRGRAYDYLKKPVRLDELQACLARVEANRESSAC